MWAIYFELMELKFFYFIHVYLRGGEYLIYTKKYYNDLLLIKLQHFKVLVYLHVVVILLVAFRLKSKIYDCVRNTKNKKNRNKPPRELNVFCVF